MTRAIAIGLMLLSLSAAAEAVAGEDLRVSLHLDKTTFYVGEPIRLWLTCENRSKETLRIPAGSSYRTLEVKDGRGVTLPFAGVMVERPPGEDGSAVVPPGGKWVERLSPTYDYKTRTEGEYSAEARVEGTESFARFNEKRDRGRARAFVGSVRSEPVRFTVRTIDDPGISALAGCLVKTDGEVCILEQWRRLLNLGTGTVLAPYAEIAKMSDARTKGWEPKDLVAWKHEFERRFPAFDQPSYLIDELVGHLQSVKDRAQLDQTLKEASESLKDHPVILFSRARVSRSQATEAADSPTSKGMKEAEQ